MNCRYCNVECHRRTPLPTDSKIIQHECPSCGSNYRLLADGGLMYITWNVQMGNYHYFIKIYDGVTGNAPTFVIYHETKNAEGHTYWEELIRWHFIPEAWTPQNVQDKLKTYLPFL